MPGQPGAHELAVTWPRLQQHAAAGAADFGAVCTQVPLHPEWATHGVFEVVLTGFGEAMSPAIVGFTLLSLAWLVVAIGHRRAAAAA